MDIETFLEQIDMIMKMLDVNHDMGIMCLYLPRDYIEPAEMMEKLFDESELHNFRIRFLDKPIESILTPFVLRVHTPNKNNDRLAYMDGSHLVFRDIKILEN